VGDGNDHPSPTKVGTSRKWGTVSSGGVHSCSTHTSGAAYCWGENNDGELGVGGIQPSSVPVKVG
jgi:hypothetical protein